ncbi:tachykinin-3 [Ornithorhynchus anatinus]|uniref:tachykinin-3 n=1 Tax=Ornithorhynchus anatinus TaxID=9258 RepID=UPI0010A898FF|nr:tachykinin-3 [Ornithorhynchus anatinus]
MRGDLLLVAIMVLAVGRSRGAECEVMQHQPEVQGGQSKPSDLPQLPLSLLRRLYDSRAISLDGLLGLLAQTSADPRELASPQKRDMHDFFVGLMGKRRARADSPLEGDKDAFPSFRDPKYSSSVTE